MTSPFSSEATAVGPEVADVSPSYAAHSTAVKLVAQDAEESSGPSIEDAEVIVVHDAARPLATPALFREVWGEG